MSDNSSPGFPLSPEQLQFLQGFTKSMSPYQMAWLGGYMTALSGNAIGLNASLMPSAMQMPVSPASAGSSAKLTVLFGTQTGNSEKVTNMVIEAAKAKGIEAEAVDMTDFRPAQLKKVTHLMVIISTQGEGDPPDSAMEFYEYIHGSRAPKLNGTKFSVCGLGDLSYERFCQMGKDFDARLEQLGGRRVYKRVDCDVDYHDTAEEWLTGALEVFNSELTSGVQVDAGGGVSFPAFGMVPGANRQGRTPPSATYDERNPFYAEVIENIVLNDQGSSKETRHVELLIEGSGMHYDPGDAVGILPSNDPELVDEILKVARLGGEERVSLKGGELRLRDALIKHLDITNLTRPLVYEWTKLSNSTELKDIANDPAKLSEFMKGRQVIDLVGDYTARELTGAAFAGILRKKPPRLYSIASSLEAHPGEVHMCIATVRYETFGRKRKGVCSNYLAERVAIGGKVPCYIHANRKFKLPESPDTPVIMIGPGTGVAPFRAFVEEREAMGVNGKSWLFFGDQHFSTDFLYQSEWLRYLDKKVLAHLDIAFSRDQREKVYVQHLMVERGKELWAWLQEGAAVYVCGDESRMAGDVNAALLQIARDRGGFTDDQAREYLKQLKKDNRYQRDVY